jgi:hypothetical protein
VKKGAICAALAAAAVAYGSSLAYAASNTGTPERPATPNDLTETPVGVTTILYAPSEADDPAFRAAIGAITVDYFDARAATPDLPTLQGYNCVFTWANFAYSDATAFGDNLAAFVDGGGVVALGAFTTYTVGNSLGGQIMTAGYSPVTGGSNHFASSAYAGDGTSAIYAGVVAFDAEFRDFLTLQGAGVQDGSYLDAEIAHAYRPDFRVVASNGAGGAPVLGGGDWPLLIANICGGGTQAPSTLEVPTLGVFGLAVLGLALAGGAVLLLRRRTA